MNYENLHEIERSIGGNIKRIRMLKGFSQMKTAELLGISFQQLQKYESGANRISPGKIFLLSQYLNVPISTFFKIDGVKDFANDDFVLGKEEAKVLELYKSLKNPMLQKKVLELCSLLNDLKQD